ncbi:ATP-binding cassette domain-containing protein [Kordiimonas sp.]|uniref:ATP-binding cassette domain-containing protein n=1 Tax=Kordiimonas sp. TaxID=1970157 RepID=UPI003A948D38
MQPLIDIQAVSKSFSACRAAIQDVSASLMPGQITGIVGPDGAGKTTLLRMMAGLLTPDEGRILVDGEDRCDGGRRRDHLAYMPQHFGLYEDLTVMENLQLYGDLRSLAKAERPARYETLLQFTGLGPFTERLAGRLSGGMKQKLGLACALIRTPKILLLDEPSVGVDPISRRELWAMKQELAGQGMAIVWSTAYLDEAARCSSVLLLESGRVLYSGPPGVATDCMEGQSYVVQGLASGQRRMLVKVMQQDGVLDATIEGHEVRFLMAADADRLTPRALDVDGDAVIVPVKPRFEDAFITLLGGARLSASPFADMQKVAHNGNDVSIHADGLTRRFGDFVAADQVSFSVGRGEIFGLIGPNGAGKSTTFKMLCGLLKPSAGNASVAGLDLRKASSKVRGRIGYMAQGFALYGDLSVIQNLTFFAGIYGLKRKSAQLAIERVSDIFGLAAHHGGRAGDLSLGFKRRLALACSVMHGPDILFLDEPTSGVDPKTRREFWGHINAMVSRGVTIIVTTHFLHEAEYCDQVALINKGRIIAAGAPDALKSEVCAPDLPNPTLEDAFVSLVARQEAAA